MQQFLGIDLGTSAVKCLVADATGGILAKARRSYFCTPTGKKGYLEQNPWDWWLATKEALQECLEMLPNNHIAAISFSGHMSAPVLMDRECNVIGNAILIADTRSKSESARLRSQYMDAFLQTTGNIPIDAFTVSKLLWLKHNRWDLYKKIHKIIFPKDFIRFMLTGKLATDYTDAGNTLLYNPKQREWNRTLIEAVGLPFAWFPPLFESTDLCGVVTKSAAKETGLAEGVPVICGAADMACSQIGTGGFSEEIMALTLSTSIQMVVAMPAFLSSLTGKWTYHPSANVGEMYGMGSIFSGGMSVDWLYKLLNNTNRISADAYFKLNQMTQERYEAVPCNDLIFLPFLTGSGSPWFDAKDRGGFLGMTADVSREDLMIAVLEGIAFNIKDNIDLIEHGCAKKFKIHLAGGGSKLTVWVNILANILNQPIYVLEQKDVSSLGAVILAGVGIKAFVNFADCFKVFNKVERIVESDKRYLEHYILKYQKYQKWHDGTRERQLEKGE